MSARMYPIALVVLALTGPLALTGCSTTPRMVETVVRTPCPPVRPEFPCPQEPVDVTGMTLEQGDAVWRDQVRCWAVHSSLVRDAWEDCASESNAD